MSRQKRVTITLKLLPGKDDDLIDWWVSIPAGGRQSLVKGVLRAYAQQTSGLPPGSPQQDDATWIRETLAALPGYLEQVVARVAAAPPILAHKGTLSNPSHTGLTGDEVERRERKIARTRW